jgi:exonuclease III
MAYSREQLVEIRQSVIASNVRLDCSLWTTIKQAGICPKRPTHRGTRAGRNRRINVVITHNRKVPSQPSTSTVNTNNLTTIHKQDNGNKLNLSVSLMNCQSIGNKTSEIVDYVIDHDVDVVALTETWLKADDQDNAKSIGDVTPDGYTFKHVARSGRKGGGVGLLFRKTLSVKVTPVKVKSFECMDACITTGGVTLRIIVVYRLHPKFRKNGINSNLFFEEFADLLSKQILLPGQLIFLGDFNIHWNKPTDTATMKLNDIIDSYGLRQHVHQPTQTCGNTLDLVITRHDDDVICDVAVSDMISDHAIVDIKLAVSKPGRPKKKVSYRKYRAIDINQLRTDILECDLTVSPSSALDQLVEQYDTCLSNLMDKHAPIRTKVFTERPLTPWYNTAITEAKKWRRKCERLYRRTGLTVHKDIYKEARQTVNKMIADAKLSYYNEKIMNGCPDQKSLFSFLNKVCHKKQVVLPDQPADKLVSSFNDFFVQKIERIRKDLDEQAGNIPQDIPEHDTERAVTSLTSFTPVSVQDVEKILSSASGASCALDPIPTWILKNCKQELLPVITKIVNLSLTSGSFPKSMKKALVKPLIKKSSLDPDDYKNYRPVSNLGFVSKVVERVVANQLKYYVNTNNLDEELQSAYRSMHSTETALLKVVSDIRCSIDNNQGVILLLLDLSAAFDTVDYQILFDRLARRLGITGVVLKWLKSYLHSRTQCVTIMDAMSVLAELLFGVPQGSVLGPLLFVIYILPLSDIIRRHGVTLHSYADDTQLYIAFDHKDPSSISKAVETLEACVDDIRIWMIKNRLKMNDSKTEMIIFAPPRAKIPNLSITVGTAGHQSADSVRNLGVLLDKNLAMDVHIKRVCQLAYFQLRTIRTVQQVLSPDALERLVHAFVTARLDYCNSILYGIPEASVKKLQLVQNSAARLVSKTHKYEHITPVLKALHWLPVSQRIDFKVLILTYKALNGLAPSYIANMLQEYRPARTLRTTDCNLLVVPRARLKTAGQRSFHYAAPHLWNHLPNALRRCSSFNMFKSSLKTHLFNVAYS